MDGIVVVGASQGGVRALSGVVKSLPADFPAPVVVVLHVGAERSMLPSILTDLGGLKASHTQQDERLKAGHIYVAPSDRHVLVVDGRLALSRGPRENWARPAIDPLFRTAAEAYGERAVGVVLTGLLNDGTAGLFEIKRRGGVAIVQDPAEAEAPSMPRSALENVAVDYVLPLSEIGSVLVKLVGETSRRATGARNQDSAMEIERERIQRPVAQTCPECGGAMREETFGTLKAFRCHIGHTMTAEVLALAQLYSLETAFGTVLRLLNERWSLCIEMADERDGQGRTEDRDRWRAAASQAQKREAAVRELAETGLMNPEAATAPAVDA